MPKRVEQLIISDFGQDPHKLLPDELAPLRYGLDDVTNRLRDDAEFAAIRRQDPHAVVMSEEVVDIRLPVVGEERGVHEETGTSPHPHSYGS